MSKLSRDLVSPCCGAEYEDNTSGPSNCCDAELTHGLCMKCKEHSEPEDGFICNTCEEFFEEPEMDYEYEQNKLESHIENQMDAEKDEF